MNREIKFRGKRIDNGEWVYGDLVQCEERFFISEKDVYSSWCYNHAKYMITEVIPESVGQYTGLKDKSDKEIYEGDIYYALGIIEAYEVSFNSGSFNGGIGNKFSPLGWTYENDDFEEDNTNYWVEIIGNIHENKDLIK